jgi:hypothetical protein
MADGAAWGAALRAKLDRAAEAFRAQEKIVEAFAGSFGAIADSVAASLAGCAASVTRVPQTLSWTGVDGQPRTAALQGVQVRLLGRAAALSPFLEFLDERVQCGLLVSATRDASTVTRKKVFYREADAGRFVWTTSSPPVGTELFRLELETWDPASLGATLEEILLPPKSGGR